MKLKLAILSAFAISASANPKITLGVGGGYARAGSTLKIDDKQVVKTTISAEKSAEKDLKESGNGGSAGAFLEVGYKKSGIEFGLTGGVSLLFAKLEPHKFEQKPLPPGAVSSTEGAAARAGASSPETATAAPSSANESNNATAATTTEAGAAGGDNRAAAASSTAATTTEAGAADASSASNNDNKGAAAAAAAAGATTVSSAETAAAAGATSSTKTNDKGVPSDSTSAKTNIDHSVTTKQTKFEFQSSLGYLFGLGVYVGGSPMDKLSVKAGALVTFLQSDSVLKSNDKDENQKIPVSIGVMPFARVSYAITSKIDAFLGFGWNFGLSDYKPTASGNASDTSSAKKSDSSSSKQDAVQAKDLSNAVINEVKLGNVLLLTAGLSFKLM